MASTRTAPGRMATPEGRSTTAEQRLRVVMDLMVRQAYSVAAKNDLAAKWNVQIGVVEKYAAEASRFIKIHMETNVDSMREQILASVRLIAEQAIDRKDTRGALKALELQSKIYGIIKPEAHEVRHKFDDVSDEDLSKALLEAPIDMSPPVLGR